MFGIFSRKFSVFSKNFSMDKDTLSIGNEMATNPFADSQLNELMKQFGGKSFNNGLYRILAPESITQWNSLVIHAFPNFTGRITCFAMDWLSRIFAIDTVRLVDGKPSILMFEPGTAQALEIPNNLESFHESELIEYRDAALSESFYKQWIAQGGVAPNSKQCVGYKVPLYLGGNDIIGNLELSDVEVYWGIAAQLIAQTRGLPAGTKIDKIQMIKS